MQRWVRKGRVQDLFWQLIRWMDSEEDKTKVEEKDTEEQKVFHTETLEIIKKCSTSVCKGFPKNLLKALPPTRMDHEFKIDLEDKTAPIHKSL